MIYAYFDESERPGGTFCVACYCFFPEQARKASREIGRLLGDKVFHATDLAALRGEFSGYARPEADELLRNFVGVIRRRAAFGAAFSCNPKQTSEAWPDFDGSKSAYAVCLNFCMVAIRRWSERVTNAERVAYVFETGHRCEAEARRFLANLSLFDELKELFSLHSHEFAGKRQARLLSAADLLAWECAKYMEETKNAEAGAAVRPMRKSLEALLSEQRRPVELRHMNKQILDDFLVRSKATIEKVLIDAQLAATAKN